MALPPDSAPIAELEYEPSAFEQALAKHRTKIITVVVLAALGGAAYYSLNLWKEHTQAVSGAAFFKAQTLEDYRRVAKEEAGKNAAGNAILMAAQILVEDGKPEDAVKELEGFLKDYASHPLADVALLRLADANLVKGAREEAKTKFEELYSKFPKSPQAPLALLRLGDIYASDKKPDEAKKYYDLNKEKYPGNPYFSQAQAHAASLSQKEPALVEFVPEPAAPPPTPGAPNIPSGEAPKMEINAPSLSLDPNAPATGVLEAPKLEVPAIPTPPPATPTPDAAPAPAAPAAPAPATPAPAPPEPAK